MKFSKNLMNRRLKDIFVRNEISKDLKNRNRSKNEDDLPNTSVNEGEHSPSLPRITKQSAEFN